MVVDDEQVFAVGTVLEHGGYSESEIDEYLAHHGVKGMKWGERKAARQRNRQLNKESRRKDWDKQEKSVQRARDRVASGKTQQDYKKAKAKYKSNKRELGSREAKKALAKARDKKYKEINKSQEAKNGKEALAGAALILGMTALGALAGASKSV